jgi:hypothetical protein
MDDIKWFFKAFSISRIKGSFGELHGRLAHWLFLGDEYKVLEKQQTGFLCKKNLELQLAS